MDSCQAGSLGAQGFWWQCDVYSDTRDDRLLTSWGTIQLQIFFFFCNIHVTISEESAVLF